MASLPRRRLLPVALVTLAIVAACSTTKTGVRDAIAPSTVAGSSSTSRGGATSTTTAKSGAQASSATTASPAQPLTWQPCTDTDLQPLECSSVNVPLDYNDPSAGTIAIALSRFKATDQANRIGSLLVNPGGPGGSGLDLAGVGAATFPPDVVKRFDIIGFDPRGVGKSAPIDCIKNRDAFVARTPPIDKASADADLPNITQIASDCQAKYGSKLLHVSTVEAVKDMDRIRAALGDTKLTYLGYSYGTVLGSLYASMFPNNVRALVLDGAVDPKGTPSTETEAQAPGFDMEFTSFANACKADSTCPANPDPVALMQRVRTKVKTSPIPTSEKNDTRKLTDGLFETAVIASLYDIESWYPLAYGLDQADKGDSTVLMRLADSLNGRKPDGTYENIIDANTAITCADTTYRPTTADVEPIANQVASKSPLLGASVGWSLLQCSGWPVPAANAPSPAENGNPPLLIVGTKGDPATPYPWALAMQQAFPHSTLLTWQGEGHTAFTHNDCIDTAVANYLLTLKEPAATGNTCPARDSSTPASPFQIDRRRFQRELVYILRRQGAPDALARCGAQQMATKLSESDLDIIERGDDTPALDSTISQLITNCR